MHKKLKIVQKTLEQERLEDSIEPEGNRNAISITYCNLGQQDQLETDQELAQDHYSMDETKMKRDPAMSSD